MSLFRQFFVLVSFIFLSGCLLHPPYDVAAVVIHNKTPHTLTYRVFSTNAWSESANIQSQDAEYYIYDIIDSDSVPPNTFNKIEITLPKCNFLLDRTAVEKYFVRDPDGRKGWNLYINEKLLVDFGCK